METGESQRAIKQIIGREGAGSYFLKTVFG
jgi:hypothetical protein